MIAASVRHADAIMDQMMVTQLMEFDSVRLGANRTYRDEAYPIPQFKASATCGVSELNENVPLGAGWLSPSCTPRGDIDNESQRKRDRMKFMAVVKAKELSQVQAAELLGLCYRQAKRVWQRHQKEGDAGLVRRLRGKPGLRCKPAALRTQVLKLCAENRYEDSGEFGYGHSCYSKLVTFNFVRNSAFSALGPSSCKSLVSSSPIRCPESISRSM